MGTREHRHHRAALPALLPEDGLAWQDANYNGSYSHLGGGSVFDNLTGTQTPPYAIWGGVVGVTVGDIKSY